MMPYLYETHLHTAESSRCARSSAKDMVHLYRDHGYRGVIVTDHFTGSVSYVPDRRDDWRRQVDAYCRGYELAKDEGQRCGLDVFFGIEQCFQGDECLIYGVDKAWLYAHPEIAGWSRSELLREITAAGGCVVHAHPFRMRSYVNVIRLNRCVHAIEVFNAGNGELDDRYALWYSRRLGLPMTAGSDTHAVADRSPETLYGVESDTPWTDIQDYVRALRGGTSLRLHAPQGRGQGELMPLPIPCEEIGENGEHTPWHRAYPSVSC